MNKNVILSFAAVAFYVGFSLAFALYANASGLLRVNPQNPRYFTDDSGRAIYLGGNQIFGDLQDYGWSSSYTDWRGYLKFARNKNLNFLRNWTIWSTHGGRATPMQYLRTGPGTAADGQPKFDLTQFNQDFFDRMDCSIAGLHRPGRENTSLRPEAVLFLLELNKHLRGHPSAAAIRERVLSFLSLAYSGAAQAASLDDRSTFGI